MVNISSEGKGRLESIYEIYQCMKAEDCEDCVAKIFPEFKNCSRPFTEAKCGTEHQISLKSDNL